MDNLCEQEGIVLANKAPPNRLSSIKSFIKGGNKSGNKGGNKSGMELGMWRDKVAIIKPMTFMNNSGDSVASYAKYHNISPNETLVIHDELDFGCGVAKFKFSGSEGGNNGLKSISARFGSRDYWRLRIGIGRPQRREDVVNYVLKPPKPDERQKFQELVPTILLALEHFVWQDKSAAIKSLHTLTGR